MVCLLYLLKDWKVHVLRGTQVYFHFTVPVPYFINVFHYNSSLGAGVEEEEEEEVEEDEEDSDASAFSEALLTLFL